MKILGDYNFQKYLNPDISYIKKQMKSFQKKISSDLV